MAITIQERKNPQRASKTKDGYEREREFLVTGVSTPEEALSATGSPDEIPNIGDAHPTTSLNMEVTRLEATMFEDDDTRWIVRVSYSPEEEDERTSTSELASLSSFSFDTGRETKHITQAETATPSDKSFARSGESAPLSKGLIGWDGEKAQGVDIPTGAFRFAVQKKYAEGEITSDYIKTLSRNAFVVNQSAWGGWDAGEVLFEGAQGRYTGGGSATSIGDKAGHLGGFEGITGVTSDNSYNGALFVSLEKITGLGNYKIRLYSDPARTELVAYDDLASLSLTNHLNSSGGSGIGGTISLYKYLYDTDDIVIQFPFPWEITYSFAISPHRNSLTVGDINVTDKEGWEYADVRYGPEEQDVDGDTYIVESARYVYLHETFEKTAFTFLNLDEDNLIPG